LKSAPRALHYESKAEIEFFFSICPKLLTNAELSFYGLVFAPRLEKRIPSNLGGQFATLGTYVSAFISNLGPICNSKKAQNWPQFFWALTPSVKRA